MVSVTAKVPLCIRTEEALVICHRRSAKRLRRSPKFSLCRKNPGYAKNVSVEDDLSRHAGRYQAVREEAGKGLQVRAAALRERPEPTDTQPRLQRRRDCFPLSLFSWPRFLRPPGSRCSGGQRGPSGRQAEPERPHSASLAEKGFASNRGESV
ncbi:hypothetical protein EYF80_015671 [Liparis tanakae]|uniref:Uncharacterized protein n=1 Tax=Liparis tanakae TaxID=230148 RepID=A0A4Z2I851_9TELE|nr:hypothetical protein EYF80_015671 [Liparis tanakae]